MSPAEGRTVEERRAILDTLLTEAGKRVVGTASGAGLEIQAWRDEVHEVEREAFEMGAGTAVQLARVSEVSRPRAKYASAGADGIKVGFEDGIEVWAPLTERLAAATQDQRNNWRWSGGHEGMHWPDLDEDVSVELLRYGREWVGREDREP
jgi:hypothetical protein